MYRSFLRAKLHGAHVTGSELHYEGSILLGGEFLEAIGLDVGEQVEIYNVENGARFSTYVLDPAPARRGDVILNGAAARMVQPGDRLIICAYAWVDLAREQAPVPRIALIQDRANQFTMKG